MNNRVSALVRYIAALLLFVACLPVAAQDLPTAIRSIQNQNYPAARTTLDALLEKSSRKPEFYYWYGRSFTEQADQEEDLAVRAKLYEEAKKWFAQGVERNSKYALNYVGLGRYYALTGNLAEAKANLTKAETLEADEATTLIQMGDAWRLTGGKEGRDKATTLLAKAETMGQNNPEVYIMQGQLWHEQNVEDLPITYYDKAIAANPNNAEAYYRKGEYYIKYKKWKEGAEALQKALQIDPNFAPALQQMGELYFRAKQYGLATDYYKQYVALREKGSTKKDINARYRYAQFLYLKKDYQAALDEIAIVEKDTVTNVLLRLKAYSNFELGKIAEAKQALTTYFSRIDPKYTIARDYEYRGKIAMTEGRLAEGEADILKATQMDETRTDLFNDLVTLYSKAKKFERAIAIQRRAVARDPGIQNYYALGKVLSFQYDYLKDSANAAVKAAAPAANAAAVKDYPAYKDPKIKVYLMGADSAFGKTTELRPNFTTGYLERARINALMDPETEVGLAKPYYEKLIELCASDPVKYKKELVESYYYMSYYYHNVARDNAKALDMLQKLFTIDPNFERGKDLKRFIEEELKG